MRKLTIVLVINILCVLFISFSAAAALPPINASSAILMDAKTGRVLYEKSAHDRRAQASTTKMMTAIVGIENGSLEDIYTVSENAAHTGGSSMNLSPGEKQSLENLLYGLMLRSGNDAAVAIAENTAGSVEAFVEMMNKKAKEIGAKNTHFMNPHGLDMDEHYSTAYDLALIARYGLSNPTFAQIVKTQKKVVPWPGFEWDRVLYNKNKMLASFEGADGVKTGYTNNAGRTLVSSATRESWQLIAVVMNSPSMWEESSALLNYGFSEYKPVIFADKARIIRSLPVKGGVKSFVDAIPGGEVVVPLTKDEEKKAAFKVTLPETLEAPVKAGEKLGEASVIINGEVVFSVDLVAKEEIPKKPFFLQIVSNVVSLFTKMIIYFA